MADVQDDTAGSAKDPQSKLSSLKASATQQYALKNYEAASDYYSEAATLQDEINGEMSPENADLLYLYGRCLYHVGVSKSDVLGGKVASSQEPKRKKRRLTKPESSSAGAADGKSDALKTVHEKLSEDVVEAALEEKEAPKGDGATSKPFFQITGDENWTDSEEEDEPADGVDGEAQTEDDFATSYEVLDLARVLYKRKLETIGKSVSEDGAQTSMDEAAAAAYPEIRQIKERLADTHDLQAEIKLENEQFAEAVEDAKASLKLKEELYPQESGLIAEAHFKLAIALDFASLPTTSAEDEANGIKPKEEPKVDEAMRAEAAAEMEKAIASCKLRLSKEEAGLQGLEAGKLDAAKRSIADVKDMVQDMNNRLVDLRNPSTALKAEPAGMDTEPLKGVLGQLLGESKTEQAKRIAEASEKANDLSGLVKRKKPGAPAVPVNGAAEVEGKGKRKAEVIDGDAAPGKRVKFEEKFAN